ncbi:DUF3180 domain-containing protein [Rhizohabitans arisaemae]|uniref:DUF3180 domain-containing protein n=1 Tax=Rhizohabitans arisaemae TaxID=2720610 RepID=UPI0024B109B8|nr:DUF3180 domain-containing protein [Rhizohabitans arisaemae]
MKSTRPGVLVVLVLGCAAIVWLLLQNFYSVLPTLPWTAIPTLLVLALGESYTGVMTRSRIRRRPGYKPAEPLAVARLVALAKASAYMGSALAGFFAGFVLHLIPLFDQPTPRRDLFIAVGTLVAAIALVGSALFLEYACRVPRPPDEEPKA